MTKRECAVVMAFTGTTMLKSEDIKIFYDYLEELFGRPVYTHELENELIWAEIKEKSQKDFVEICRMAEDPVTNGDRIRSMTDEELSIFLGRIADNCSYNTCDNCPMYGACVDVPLSRDKWLKKEAD